MFNRDTNEIKKSFDFYYTELSAMAEYLEQKEKEGYRLKKIENKRLIFEKCDPRDIRYSVEIFTGSSYREFIDSCTLEGWEHVTTYNGELYIFRTQKSDAIDIMTDEKEKFKVTAKKTIFQPGVWYFFFYAFFPLFELVRPNIGIKLFETDVINYTSLLFLVLYVFITLLRLFDCFLWQYTVRKKGADSPFFNLKNTIKKRRTYAIINAILFITLQFILWWIAPQFYSSIIVILFSLALLFCRCLDASLSNLNFDKANKTKKTILTCVVIVLCIGGAFLVKNCNEKYIFENSKTMLSLEEAPISIEDLNGKVKSCEDHCFVDGTRFGQLYEFSCSAEFQEDNDMDDLICYYILISDYPRVREKYIDKVLEDYEGYNCEKIIPPDTKWDYCYLIKWNDENRYDGFAIKDNLIIYLRYSVDCKENFFDVAYKELFEK